MSKFYVGGKPNSPFCLFGQMGAPQNLINKFDFVRQAVRCLGSPRAKGITPSRHPLERQNYNFFVGKL